MLNKLFTFFIVLSLASCASDNSYNDPEPTDDTTDDSGNNTDDGQGQTGDLIISRFTFITYADGNPPQPDRNSYYFDEEGRVTREEFGPLSDPTPFTYEYRYDANGRLVTMDYFSGDGTFLGDIQYEFDAEGRVSRRINNASNSEAIVTTYSYKGNDVIALDERSGDLGVFTFDAEGRLTKMAKQLNIGSSDPFGVDFNYDEIGNVRRIDHWDNDGVILRHILDYDQMENPLHDFHKEYLRPYLYLTRPDQYDHENFQEFFTPNNYTSYSNAGAGTGSDIKITQYDEAGYPTSAIIERNGELWQEITYEYQ